MCIKYVVVSIAMTLMYMISAQPPCERLHRVYKGAGRYVRIDGTHQEVVVLGAGGSARAAAALLLTVVRHVLKYSARLDQTEADVCRLSAAHDTSVVLAPAAILNEKGCGAGERSIDYIASLIGTAAVTINLQFMARISPKTNCTTDLSWTLLKNATALKHCDFLISENINFTNTTNSKTCNQPNCVKILARNESDHDKRILVEFKKRATAANLDNIDIITFKNDSAFRRELFQLRNSDSTFLFIDENLWTTDPNVYELKPPPCPKFESICSKDSVLDITNAIRIGDGYIVKEYAPPIFKMINRFSPTNQQIQDILEYEYSLDYHNIEEAACFWALKHKDEFEKWFKLKNHILLYPPVYHIEVYLCKDDPYNHLYKKVEETVGYMLWRDINDLDYIINTSIVNCTDSHELRRALNTLLKKRNMLAGAVTWSYNAGVSAASNFVQYTQIPLMLAGPARDSLLGEATYATSGRLSDIARAYRYFLSQCEWRRVAIISDDTNYSKSFTEAILSEGNLNYADIVVTRKTMFSELNKIKSQDARIFIINTSCKMADAILSEAKNLFLPSKNYVWIVRDWCIVQNRTINDDVSHFTIEVSWRGGNVFGGSNELRFNLAKNHVVSRNNTISPGITQLADALLLIGHGFAVYRRANLSSRYDLHGFGTARDFFRAISGTNVTGVAQYLSMKNFSLHEPFIFVHKWQSNERRTMAIWKLVNSTVTEIWSAINDTDSCYSILAAQRVQDGNKCIVRSGDEFSPRCHDIFILISFICLIIVCVGIFVAQKIRRKRLKAENTALIARLLESRQKKASNLLGFLVDRGSIRILHEIGSGCYGRVHFAELTRPGCQTLVVAAKEPHVGFVRLVEENEILREACVLARLEHNNVIRLMGVCIADGPPLVLMEHAIYLDLQRYLTERRHLAVRARHGNDTDYFEVSDESLTRFAYDAASALEYLTERRLVHRDIRAANCLIDKQRSLKLADFGMARELDEEDSTYMTCRKGLFPVLWMAPESLERGVFSPASDIWAIGVLVLEIATLGSRPYGDWPKCHVMKHVIAGGRPSLPPDASMQMSKLLQMCWHQDPEARITAAQLRKYLTENPKVISPALLAPEPPPLTPPRNSIYEHRFIE